MPVGQKQESRSKPAGSTERLGYCGRGWSVAVTVVIVAATEAVLLKFTPWVEGDEEVADICWISSSSEMRSTSMITGDVCSFELSDSAGRVVIVRDEPKKESILG